MRRGLGHAHGKIILIGEHAVVYESRAISIPFFETHCEVEVTEAKATCLACSLYQGPLNETPSEFEAISSVIEELEKKFALPPLNYVVKSNIPISSGMGSSAAVAGSIVRAVYDYLGTLLADEEHFLWIQFAERIAHGNPSGIDALTTSKDEAWLFQRGKKPISFDPKLDAYLIVGQSGALGSTKIAVSSVRRLVDSEGKYYLIEAIADAVEKAYAAYLKQDVEELGSALNQAQEHLSKLNLSTSSIDDMVTMALETGAAGAKLTGGGLGGCVIALAKTKVEAEAIQEKWRNYSNLPAWVLDLNEGK